MVTFAWIIGLVVVTFVALIIGIIVGIWYVEDRYNNGFIAGAISVFICSSMIFFWISVCVGEGIVNNDTEYYSIAARSLTDNMQLVQPGDLVRNQGGIYLVKAITPSAIILTDGVKDWELKVLDMTSKDIWLSNIDLPERKAAREEYYDKLYKEN